MIGGLRYAFPRAMAKQERKHRCLVALHDRVAARRRLAVYISHPPGACHSMNKISFGINRSWTDKEWSCSKADTPRALRFYTCENTPAQVGIATYSLILFRELSNGTAVQFTFAQLRKRDMAQNSRPSSSTLLPFSFLILTPCQITQQYDFGN